MLAKEPLFYGARRSHRKGTGQGVRALRTPGSIAEYVQRRQQPSVRAEDRRTGAAQIHMPRPEMLDSVNCHGPLLGDAGADAVGTLDLLGPDAASQVPQYSNWLASVASPRCSIATPAVSQSKIVYTSLANHFVRRSSPPARTNDVAERLTETLQPFARGEDAWRPAVDRIDAARGTLPGTSTAPRCAARPPLA